MSIRYEPAECHPNCADELCPYHHTDAWYVIDAAGDEHGPYQTKEEAIAINAVLCKDEL